MDLEPEGVVPADTDEVVGDDPVILEIEELLTRGDLERALSAIDEARERRVGKAIDLTFLRGDACLGLGRAVEAERAFREVLAQDPDCPSSRCWLAMSLFLQWRFDEAMQAVQLAREVSGALPDADVILGCLCEHRGDLEQADSLFAKAAAALPDKYPVVVRLDRQRFDREVRRAVRQLPRQFRQALDRVPVVVQDLPDRELVEGGDVELTPDILGLFVGLSLLETGEHDGPPPLNKIYLFQRNLERMSNDEQDLVEQIRVTLWHELAHYLGFEEDEMGGLGLD
ncbi:MAG TPA: tetratricopeptide repeat protein [bacterium]|nr:tetratricopeptide repeat protein [bacterium]